MTKISIYQIDDYVTADDKWIGTDVNTYNKTKNFTPRKVAKYFNENEVINTSNSIRYRYDTIAITESRQQGTLSFQTEIGATVPINTITTFILSKDTQGGKDVSNFLNVLPTTKVILQKADNIDIFGLFRIISVVEDLIEPGFFVVTLEFLSGNGSLEEDKDYIISLIDLQKIIEIPQLVKETFDYESSNTFTLSNVINNVLQVIVNTTSLHPEAYSYTLPSTVTVINDLYAGDVITVVYNYVEEFFEVPDLQKVTDEGNHTTNNIIIDSVTGEWGSYTASNTLNELGAFQSFTSPTYSPDYQTTYAGYEMSISEIYTPIERKEILIYSGIVQASYINGSNYNALRLDSGDNANGPSFYIEKNNINGQLRIDDITENITLQFPDKPLGTYTIATTDDVSPNYWTNTGNDIVNNNIGNVNVGNGVYASLFNANSSLGNYAFRADIASNTNGLSIYSSGSSKPIYIVHSSTGDIFKAEDGLGITKSKMTSSGLWKYGVDLSSTYDDRSLVDKGYVNNRLVVETASPYTLTNADSGGIVIFTASTTLTIPTGLADGFECTFVTLSGVTLTVVSTGNTLNNATSTTMLPQLSFTLKRMLAANTYIATGDL